MSKWLAVLVLSGMLLQIFSRQLIYAEFAINQEFLSRVLCEKKDIPQNHCQGKCLLKKQLEKEKQRQNHNQQQSQNNFEVYFWEESNGIDLIKYSSPNITYTHTVNSQISDGFYGSVFHPPA